MKFHKLKAIRWPDDDVVDENALYVIQEVENKFTVWQDFYGEMEDGEPPIFSEINESLEGFNSLEEADKLLKEHKLVESNTKAHLN